MSHPQRADRLQADHETLQKLSDCSSLFQFEATGRPPDRYLLSFHGRGIVSALSARQVNFAEKHEVELRLPYSYPEAGPDLRWLTPILHPNVSFSGFIHLPDLGLPWDASVSLDAVCERLWDVARLAYVNVDCVSNFKAQNWLDTPGRLPVPVDRRPLRDQLPPPGVNVIRYRRRGAEPPADIEPDDDVLFIGEETPTPELPTTGRHVDRGDDEDILFIGDD